MEGYSEEVFDQSVESRSSGDASLSTERAILVFDTFFHLLSRFPVLVEVQGVPREVAETNRQLFLNAYRY